MYDPHSNINHEWRGQLHSWSLKLQGKKKQVKKRSPGRSCGLLKSVPTGLFFIYFLIAARDKNLLNPLQPYEWLMPQSVLLQFTAALLWSLRGVKEPPGSRNLSKRSVYERGYVYDLLTQTCVFRKQVENERKFNSVLWCLFYPLTIFSLFFPNFFSVII